MGFAGSGWSQGDFSVPGKAEGSAPECKSFITSQKHGKRISTAQLSVQEGTRTRVICLGNPRVINEVPEGTRSEVVLYSE